MYIDANSHLLVFEFCALYEQRWYAYGIIPKFIWHDATTPINLYPLIWIHNATFLLSVMHLVDGNFHVVAPICHCGLNILGKILCSLPFWYFCVVLQFLDPLLYYNSFTSKVNTLLFLF